MAFLTKITLIKKSGIAACCMVSLAICSLLSTFSSQNVKNMFANWQIYRCSVSLTHRETHTYIHNRPAIRMIKCMSLRTNQLILDLENIMQLVGFNVHLFWTTCIELGGIGSNLASLKHSNCLIVTRVFSASWSLATNCPQAWK